MYAKFRLDVKAVIIQKELTDTDVQDAVIIASDTGVALIPSALGISVCDEAVPGPKRRAPARYL